MMRFAQSRVVADPSSLIVAAEVACPAAMASFVVAPAARAAAIACWPRCAAMAASCALLSSSDCSDAAWFAVAYVAS
jgi:hypothetical protein